jgi:hypothetical protein
MLQEIKLTLVVCDEPVMRVGVPGHLTWVELDTLVCTGQALVWEMLGEWRLLPHRTLVALYDVKQAHRLLAQIGRSAEVSLKGFCFTRAQTVPPPWSGEQGLNDRAQMLCDQGAEAASDSSPAQDHPSESLE